MADFFDGFESNDFSAWTGTYTAGGVAVATQSTAVHHGTYGAEMTAIEQAGDEGLIFKQLADAETNIYSRVYGKISAVPSGVGRFAFGSAFRGVSPTFTNLAYTIIFRDGVGVQWGIRTNLSGAWANYLGGYETLYADQWYCVEAHLNTDGDIGLWVDGVEKVNTNVATVIGGFQQADIRGMCIDNNEAAARTCSFDCFVCSDEYIGADGTQRRVLINLEDY